MPKKKKKTIYFLIFFVLALAITTILFSSTILTAFDIETGIQFAGYTWDVTGEGDVSKCADGTNGCASSQGTYGRDENNFIDITAMSVSDEYRNSCKPQTNIDTCLTTTEDISDIDEFLIIFSGSGFADVGAIGRTSSSFMEIRLYDPNTGIKKELKSDGCGVSPINNIYATCSYDLQPQLVKFLNNFDGTYTTYTSLNVGDVFIKDKTVDATDMQNVHLQICTKTKASCRASSNGKLKIYNIVTKRLEAPVCKADQILMPDGSCEEFQSILLAHEEAIYESLDEKLERIDERLTAKEQSLQEQIDLLAQEGITKQDEVDKLLNELAITKALLEDIENRELYPPPDVDVEEIIREVRDQTPIDATEKEIDNTISEELDQQFQDRFPEGLQSAQKQPIFLYIIIGVLVLIILGLLITTMMKK